MQFRDLKTQYNVLKDEMDQAILDVQGGNMQGGFGGRQNRSL